MILTSGWPIVEGLILAFVVSAPVPLCVELV
jgi:hypothetical protein